MEITINLPHLKISDVTHKDETFYYDGYNLSTWRSELSKFEGYFEAAQEIFMQDHITIDKDLLNELGLDIEETTFEFTNLLFNNLEKAVAVWHATNKEYRFDEIKVTWEGYNEPIVFEVDEIEYVTYYEEQLIAEAKEYHESYIKDMSLEEYIGDIKYLDDYYDFFVPENLWTEIEAYCGDEKISTEDAPEDAKEAIQWFINNHDEEGEKTFELLDENDLFDYWAITESDIANADDALNTLNSYIGDSIYSGETVLNGWRPQTVWVFERN